MATADELLATMAEDGTVYDEDICLVDQDTRAVTIPERLKIIGVESDDDVVIRHFRVPAICCGTNLSTFDIRVNYMNANKEKDCYYVTDAAVDGEDISFSWRVDRTALRYKGTLQFAIHMELLDADGYIEKEWNSTIAHFDVLEGLEVELTGEEEEAARAVAAQLVLMLEKEGENQIAAVAEEAAQQVGAIEAKGAETLANIPSDYTSLGNRVGEVETNKAPAIISTANGKAICIADSASGALRRLTLYGKTTQDGTPTPSTPVPLVNIGSGGTVTVTATGKNLLPPYTSSSIFTANEDGTVTVSGYTQYQVNLVSRVQLPPGVYTLSGCLEGGSRANEPGAYAMYVLLDDGYHFDTGSGVTFALTTAQEVGANIIVRADTTMSGQVFRPQIEIGSAATAFEAYKDGGSASFSTPNGLPGIPVSSGGNYTDENGQQWLCDEIRWPEMTYVQRVGVRTLNGSEGWGAWSATTGARMITGTITDHKRAANDYDTSPILCTHYEAITANQCYNSVTGIAFDASGNLQIYNPSYTDVTAWKTHLASNPVTVMYALAEPIETTPELVIYRALASKYPSTAILNDGGAGMEASYVADTKNYVDQRIAAIAAAMINA